MVFYLRFERVAPLVVMGGMTEYNAFCILHNYLYERSTVSKNTILIFVDQSKITHSVH